MPSFPAHPTELLLELGLCYMAPRGLAAGAGGRQEQAPPATDSSSALAESARERPELGMTPVSKVPHGFIHRPKLRFPSPLNFPALLFFWGPVFPTRPIHFPERYHTTPSTPAPILTSSPSTPPPHPPPNSPRDSYLLHSSSPSQKAKGFYLYCPPICCLLFTHAR